MKIRYILSAFIGFIISILFSLEGNAQILNGNPNCDSGDGINVSLNDNSHIYLCGYGAYKPLIRTPVVSKIDTAGNVVWNFTSNRNQIGEAVSAYLEGSFLYVVCKYDSVKLPSTFNILEVSKFNAINGQRIWRKNIFVANEYLTNGYWVDFSVVNIQERDANNIIILHNRTGGTTVVNYFTTLNKSTGTVASTFINTGRFKLTDFKVDSTFSFIYGVGQDSVYKLSTSNLGLVIWKTKIDNYQYDKKLFLKNDGVFIISTHVNLNYERYAQLTKLHQTTGNLVWSVLGNVYSSFPGAYKVLGNYLYVGSDPSSQGGGYYSVKVEKYNLLNGSVVWDASHYVPDSGGHIYANDISIANGQVIVTGGAIENGHSNTMESYWFNYAVSDLDGTKTYFNKTNLDTINERFTIGVKNHLINNRLFHIGNFQSRLQQNDWNQHIEYPKTLIGLVKLDNSGIGTYKKIINFGTQPVNFPSLNDTVCQGDTIRLTHNNLSSVTTEWIINGQQYSFAADTFAVINLNSAITLKLNNGLCTNSSTYSVKLSPVANLAVSGNVTIHNGSSATLTASGGTSYFWYPNLNISSQTSSTPTVNPATTTTYYVKATDNQGCTKTDSVQVTVLNSTGITEKSNPQGYITIGPNPLHNTEKLIIERKIKGNYTLELFDLTGRRLAKHFLITDFYCLDFSRFAPGMYNLKINNNEHKSSAIKIVVY